jgi:short subunit dehydrogenase-like uncharacterized protein
MASAAATLPDMAPSQREHDLVLLGATGFTGSLVAQVLTQRVGGSVRVALAGRSQDKLSALRDGLGEAAASWPTVVVNTADDAAVRALAHSTRVLATTVGPYLEYGMPVATACADAGTHYVDLTGEVPFMRASIDANDEVARASGARIVHACGFDSIPSDLGVLLLHDVATRAGHHGLTDVTFVLSRMSGGVSGGTLASLAGIKAAVARRPEIRENLRDPYSLSPDRAAEPDLGPQPELRGVEYDRDLGLWVGPFAMAQINTRVVRRSNALQDWVYGRRFRYREVQAVGDGPAGAVKAAVLAGGMAAGEVAMDFTPTRMVAEKVLPPPGSGPSEQERAAGFFEVDLIGRTEDDTRVHVTVRASGDPGYAATSRMFTEAALALLDLEPLPDRAGVLTPATAFGLALLPPLAATDVVFAAA